MQAAFDEKDFVHLREWLTQLIKRRAQGKKAITDMVNICLNEFLDKLPSKDEKFQMLKSLRESCEGKIFLEREYASTTRMQVEILEAEGKIDDAAKVIQEIAIETYGSLDPKEKVDFILYQMKLTLARQDYIRTQVLSRKVSKRKLKEEGLEKQCVEYFQYMCKFHIHEKETLEVAKAYNAIFETLEKQKDKEEVKSEDEISDAFRNYILYLLISPQSQEKVDMLSDMEKKYPRLMEGEELLTKYVRRFLTFELVPMQENEIREQMQNFEPFQENKTMHAKNHMIELIRQMVQHNIRVIEKYYNRVTLTRMSQLVGVSVERTERELGDMVVNKRVAAKINRLAGIVVFSSRKQFPNESLNNWNKDLTTTLDKIEETCHLINREYVVHKK